MLKTLFLVLFAFAAAHADTIYTYTGNSFNQFGTISAFSILMEPAIISMAIVWMFSSPWPLRWATI